jgi:hypothetical protein
MATDKHQTMDEKNYIETAVGDAAIMSREKKRRLLEWLAFSAVLRIFTMTFYLAYRVRCMLVGSNSFGKNDIISAWVFFAIEGLFAGKLITTIKMTSS